VVLFVYGMPFQFYRTSRAPIYLVSVYIFCFNFHTLDRAWYFFSNGLFSACLGVGATITGEYKQCNKSTPSSEIY